MRLAVFRVVEDAALRNRLLARLERVVDEARQADEPGSAAILRRWETARWRVAVRGLVRAGQQPLRRVAEGLVPLLGARPYLDLVEGCGWSEDFYERWLTDEVGARLRSRPAFPGGLPA